MIKEIYPNLNVDFHLASFVIGGTWDTEWGKELMELKTFNFIVDKIEQHPDPVFVDVGANIGMYSFINKNRGFKIYSFEPNPVAFLALQENLKLNQTNTEIFNLACGREETNLFLTPEETTWLAGTISITDTRTYIPTKVVKIDDYVKEKVTHMKLDIEGFEGEALKGSERILREDGPVLFMEISNEYLAAYQWDTKGLQTFLKEFGYNKGKVIDHNNYIFEKTK